MHFVKKKVVIALLVSEVICTIFHEYLMTLCDLPVSQDTTVSTVQAHKHSLPSVVFVPEALHHNTV